MRALNFQILRQEPINSGIITGFLTLCAIAFVNLSGKLFFHSQSTPGAFLLSLAVVASIAAGGIATLRSRTVTNRRMAELQAARSLASGDFSKTIFHAESNRYDLSIALTEIADRQLKIERNNGQLIQEAAARESQLLAALDCVNQEIAVFSKNGLLICANSAYLSKCNTIGAVVALGMTRGEIWAELAKSPQAHLPLNERQSWFKAQEELRQEALVRKTPVRFLRMYNELGQMSVYSTKDGDRIEIVEDIDKVAALEQRAEKGEREAKAMDRLKQVTLTRLSHTIRTPMTGVLAAAELLSDTNLDDKQRARLNIIRRASGTLLGVVQDMFDLAESPSTPIEAPIQYNGETVKQALVCSTPMHMAQEAQTLLNKDNFDVTVFEQFAQQSGSKDAWDLANEKHPSLIIVADDAQKDHIAATNSAINLSHRPDLKLYSDLVSLTKTHDTTSNIPEVSREPAVKQPAQKAKIDVLIVESNEVNQIYLSNNLENSDYSFKIVGTGALAIEAAKDCKPRLILMDISIPDIDGLQVTAAIRATGQKDTNNPMIIGMANHFVQGDQSKCINAGMDQYMLKPQAGQGLLNLLDDWLKPQPVKMVS